MHQLPGSEEALLPRDAVLEERVGAMLRPRLCGGVPHQGPPVDAGSHAWAWRLGLSAINISYITIMKAP